MPESVHFHTDLYRRDAVELAARKYRNKARIELAADGAHVVAHVEPLARDGDWQGLRDEFCTEAFSETARKLRDLGAGSSRERENPESASEPPWAVLSPFGEGAVLGLGWALESLSPVRGGAATMVLSHERHGSARVTIRRNNGAPLGVAHTDQLDFMLMNGGSGSAQTEESVGRVLIALARALRGTHNGGVDDALLTTLLPHREGHAPYDQSSRNDPASAPQGPMRIAPRIDLDQRRMIFEIDEAGISRLAVYEAVLAFADRCHVFLTRPEPTHIAVQISARDQCSADDIRALAADVTRALNRVVRNGVRGDAPAAREAASAMARAGGMPVPSRQQVDMTALLAELDAADPATLGMGFECERGPGHEHLRVLNIRGTGACNSDCLWCVEKFDPTHRSMPKADSTRQFILDAAGRFDMLFFASGEPTIHPKLFEYVELGKSVGFTSFGMSSHFRTLADPHYALKILQAGFAYFDISLHASDAASQLEVNPIDDGGDSLLEALKGLAVLYRLARALGMRISVTHKIVVSRLNVTRLEEVFRVTYERGVRHFILQPVRAMNLAPDRQAMVDISEEEILPHLNEFLRRTQGRGAVIKPYGFSRQGLFAGDHVEHEQNRVKNVYGRVRGPGIFRPFTTARDERRTKGRHWVEVQRSAHDRSGFASDGSAPILDDALARGLELPFGCRMGSCGMCCARLLEGSVDQSNQIFLTDEQQRQGYVLLCQARPRSDVTVMICSEDELDPL
jgi:2Fe-2S type ferredoxin